MNNRSAWSLLLLSIGFLLYLGVGTHAAAQEPSGEKIGHGDGQIQVIPTLSRPSVKNGDQLKISALIKAEAGVAHVEAKIVTENTVNAENPAAVLSGVDAYLSRLCDPMALVRPEGVLANLTLKPASLSVGGVSPDGKLGLWNAEWTGAGLIDGYYRVILRITDRSGHTYVDKSLRFSDPIAGINTPGTTAYPNVGLRRVGVLPLNSGEEVLFSAVIDSSAGFAYFGTAAIPGVVVKVNLATFTRVGAITLNSGENSLFSAAIDPTAGFAYFGTNTSPGVVIKINLATLTRVGAITLNSGENQLRSAVIDPAAGFVYFGTFTSPGQVVKINLATFTRVGALALNTGETGLYSAVIDQGAGFAYFGTYTNPGQVVKIDLATFTRVGAITLNTGENILLAAAIDPTAGFAYFGTYTLPGRVVKIDLSTFTRVGAIPLAGGENFAISALIDPAGGFAYFGTNTTPGRVVKINLATFTRVGAITLSSGEDQLKCAVFDPAVGFAYYGMYTPPARVLKLGLSQEGYVKGTRFTMPESGILTTAHFYSHAAQGNVRLAIYDESTTTRLLRWQSGSTVNSVAAGWIDIPISSGTPGSVTLAAGTYWLAWQVDTAANVPSYTLGSAGNGFLAPQSYGAFPAGIATATPTTTSTNERWSEYITYNQLPASPNALMITPATIGPTNADSIDFSVAFDVPVQNFNNLDDLVITPTGTVGIGGGTITGGPTTYTVTLTGITGDGNFTLAVKTAAQGSDVSDLGTNGLSSSATSAAVQIDNTTPQASAPTDSGLTTTDSLVTFNWEAPTDNLSGVATIVLQVGTTPGGNDIYDATVTGTSYQVNGAIGQTLYARLIVTDNAGNPMTTTNSDGIQIVSPPIVNAVENWKIYD